MTTATLTRPRVKKTKVPGVSVELVEMTPELAFELLERNENNRRVKKRAIAEYVHALKSGDWQFNGDPVRVAADGQLLDGQHRLMALVEAGFTVPMVLVEGVTPETQMTMDVGTKRSYADHLKMRGEKNAAALAAIVRGYALYQRSEGRQRWEPGETRLSMSELERTLLRNPLLKESQREAHRLYMSGFKASQVATGVAHYVLTQLDGPDALFFFERIETGSELFPDGPTQPILKLREYIATRKIHEVRSSHVTLAAILKTWNAFRAGTRMSNPEPRFGGRNPEAFPWPR